jgi:hypothetical protein
MFLKGGNLMTGPGDSNSPAIAGYASYIIIGSGRSSYKTSSVF